MHLCWDSTEMTCVVYIIIYNITSVFRGPVTTGANAREPYTVLIEPYYDICNTPLRQHFVNDVLMQSSIGTRRDNYATISLNNLFEV
jgi:hypothetical protein